MGDWSTIKIDQAANTELHALFTKAHKVFEDWPHNFHQFLRVQSKGKKRLNHPHGGELDTALRREFGPFYERLYEDLRQSQFELCTVAPHLTSWGSDGYISLAQARRLLKVTHRAMFDLTKTGEIDFVIRNEGMALRYLLRLSDVESVKDKFERAISSRTLAQQLGVDCETIRRLTKEGYLDAKPRRAVNGYHTSKFDSDAAEQLLKTISELPTGSEKSLLHVKSIAPRRKKELGSRSMCNGRWE